MKRQPIAPPVIYPDGSTNLPERLVPYYEAVKKFFLDKVAKDETKEFIPQHEGRPYYWKWVATYKITKHLGHPQETVRWNLKILEKAGWLVSKRTPNNIDWGLKVTDGFEPMKFEDYLWKTKN